MKRLKGFTLVELVIVIAIVIILSVVSVPIYRNYTDKAKMSEAYSLLGTILSAEKSYYGEHGTFYIHGAALDGSEGGYYTSNCPVLGIDARGNKYFTWFRVGIGGGQGIKDTFIARVVKPNDLRNKAGTSEIWLTFSLTSSKVLKFTDDAR